jgi:hypothetical protein
MIIIAGLWDRQGVAQQHATRETGRYTRLCSSRVITGKISRWNAIDGGPSAPVLPDIANDFAGDVTKAAGVQTAVSVKAT